LALLISPLFLQLLEEFGL
jgi:hypothetical protein